MGRSKFFLIVALAALFVGCSAVPGINVSGTWEGTLTGPGGQAGYRLVLVDSSGTLTGEAFWLDATYNIWRDVGTVTGSRSNTRAVMTNVFSDGSGRLDITGTFTGDSFTGTAAFYDGYGAYQGTLDIGLTKK